jgi:formylglycine-generating enzyme
VVVVKSKSKFRQTLAASCRLLAAALLLPALPVAAAEYVPVPTGTFASVLSSGDNAPVRVAPFAMRTTPVTNREFQAFTDSHPEWQRGRIPAMFADASYLNQLDTQSLPERPVTSVSWFAAQAFCESEGGRLPSWYEWEYVAAADEQHADARRDPAWRAKILSWYSQSSSMPQPAVGGAANFYGVRDMHGLIWEWVDDFNALLISPDSRNQGDPDQLQFCGAGAISLQDRENYAILMRIALLSALGGADTTNNLGFRCARTLTMESK